MSPAKEASNGSARPGYVDVSDAKHIVSRTEKQLVDGVTCSALAVAINYALYCAIMESQSGLIRRAEHPARQLMSAFRTYVQLADKLRAYDLFPPQPPSRWKASVELWCRDIEGMLDNAPKLKPGPRPSNQKSLYPVALGLFKAAFGEEPRVWAHAEYGTSGPATQFVMATLEASIQSTTKIPLNSFQAEARSKDYEWQVPPLNTLRQHLPDAMKMPRRGGSDPDESASPPSFAWEDYARFFAQVHFGAMD